MEWGLSSETHSLQIIQESQEMEILQKNSKNNKIYLLWQKDSRNHIKKLKALEFNELGQEIQTTSHRSNII